jgi:hypothetical protein
MICMGVIAGFGTHVAATGAPPAKTAPAVKHEPCPAPCTVPHPVDCSH